MFKEPAHSVFGDLTTPIMPNVLSIRLQPDEGLRLHIMTKDPGPGGFRMHDTLLDMDFSAGRGKTGACRMLMSGC
ncbi:MAG: hypothetical protein R3E95_16940 [Thiolinea sp.]